MEGVSKCSLTPRSQLPNAHELSLIYSSLKKLLSEAQIDVQAIQRQLDQSEAQRLALEGEMSQVQAEKGLVKMI